MARSDDLARARYVQTSTLTRRVVEQVLALWRGIPPESVLVEMEGATGRRIVNLVIAGQLTVAQGAEAFVRASMAALGATARPLLGSLAAAGFAGITGNALRLDTLLYLPAVRVAQARAAGATADEAMQAGMFQMARLTGTVLADTSRSATQVAMAANPNVKYYTRVVNLPACARCIILAGQTYSYSAGFQRHPNCFPAGVVVSGPSARAATRRRYEGELVILTTASGQELPATGNHPVLTDRGWIPAKLLQEGDHVVRSTLGEGAAPLVVPDERHVPALIEDAWRPSGVVPLLQMPTTAEDFHGDGGHGDVDVVLADRFLGNGRQISFGQPVQELLLATGVASAAHFTGLRTPFELFEGVLHSADSLVGAGGLGTALLGSHLGCANETRVRGASTWDMVLGQDALDGSSADTEALCDGVLTFAAEVGADYLRFGQGQSPRPHWDAARTHRTAEDRRANAERGLDLLRRLAGQVELDRVVYVRRVDFSGHVFNLTSDEGWYSANGLIVSNCDCTVVPLDRAEWEGVQTPEQIYASMSERDRRRVFGVAGSQAIDQGADMGQIVNARRGMSDAGDATTTEGATVRGYYGRRMRRAGGAVDRGDGRYSVVTTPRLSPDEIFRRTDDRDEQVALLRANAYLA